MHGYRPCGRRDAGAGSLCLPDRADGLKDLSPAAADRAVKFVRAGLWVALEVVGDDPPKLASPGAASGGAGAEDLVARVAVKQDCDLYTLDDQYGRYVPVRC